MEKKRVDFTGDSKAALVSLACGVVLGPIANFLKRFTATTKPL